MALVRSRAIRVGSAPGTLITAEGAAAPRITVIDYSPAHLEEAAIASPDELDRFETRESVTWVDIQGLGDAALLRTIGDRFGLHDLLLEAVVNVPQRPKAEEFGEHLLLVTRMLSFGAPEDSPRGPSSPVLEREQLSVVIGEGWVLTFQERYGDILDPVRARLRAGRTRIRRLGADYLAYAILDTVVDGYFPVLEAFGEYLEGFEDRILAQPIARDLQDINDVRSALAVLRRLVWPQRDALNRVVRDELGKIGPETRVFFRDTHENCSQVAEVTDVLREFASSLVNTYLSAVSNRMNETMRILTMLSSIFIPITFIAGIYGMNFDNMPELRAAWSYPVVLGTMALVAAGMLTWFYRRGWFGRGRER